MSVSSLVAGNKYKVLSAGIWVRAVFLKKFLDENDCYYVFDFRDSSNDINLDFNEHLIWILEGDLDTLVRSLD